MVEPHVLFALKLKYARTLGALHIAHSARVGLMGDLAHLAAVTHMFALEEDLEAINPRRPYKPKRERWARTALVILRKAKRPLKAYELSRLVMRAHGVDPRDEARLFSISCSLQAVLEKMADDGLVTITGKPRRWGAGGLGFARHKSVKIVPSPIAESGVRVGAAGLLQKAAPTWAVVIGSVAVAIIMYGHKWLDAFTKRDEFRHKQARETALLNEKLAALRAKAQRAPGSPDATKRRGGGSSNAK